LRKEIRGLRLETSNKFDAKIRRASPDLKRRLMKGKKETSRFFKGLQRIADNLPKDT